MSEDQVDVPGDPDGTPGPMAPDEWAAAIRDRLDDPQLGDDEAAMRSLLADAERDEADPDDFPMPTARPRGTLPADLALPIAALMRAVARRIEARAHP